MRNSGKTLVESDFLQVKRVVLCNYFTSGNLLKDEIAIGIVQRVKAPEKIQVGQGLNLASS